MKGSMKRSTGTLGLAGLCLLAAGVAAGCAQASTYLDDRDAAAVTGADGPAVDKPIGAGGSAGGGGPADPVCAAGQHVCAGTCVSNSSVSTCGTSCSPCDQVPDGTATCDGTRCGATCPANKKLCNGACIDAAATCNSQCPSGTHACNGQCPSAQSVNACGTSCSPCPLPAGASSATCDGTKCDFTCGAGTHRCGDRCARDDDATACGSACMACPTDPGGAGAPQCVGGTCTLRCNSGNHACNGRCVSDTSPLTCGSSCDPCPVPSGGSATCTQGACGASCPANKKACKGACIDSTAACDGQCAAGTHACNGVCAANNSVNSCGATSCNACPRPTGAASTSCDGTACDFTCGSGYHRCGTSCAADDSPTGCGTSCTTCPTDPNGAATCQSGSCSLRCNNGFHLCGGKCVANNAVATCGTSCNACQAPSGGSVSCDGVNCIPSCSGNTKLCNGACIDNSQACNGQCPSGTHNCNGMCMSNTSVAACGSRCTPCPDPSSHGSATCNNGSSCGVSCENNYKYCSSTGQCVPNSGCCGNSDCTSGGTGTIGTCTSSNTCSYMCNPSTHKQCGSTCIQNSQCCNSNDCTSSSAGPICDTSTHNCKKRNNGDACSTGSECQNNSCLQCYPDGDNDGYGNKYAPMVGQYCVSCPTSPTKTVNNNGDCHDGNAAVNPAAGFHDAAFTAHPSAPDQSGWDWNCDNVVTRSLVGSVSVGAGCASQMCSASDTCTLNMTSIPTTTVCGNFNGGSQCAKSSTAMNPCFCTGVGIMWSRQTCK